MRWLITGGCGFLGTSVIQKLSKDINHSFRILDNLSVGSREDLSKVINFIELKSSKNISQLQAEDCQLIVGDIRDQDLTRDIVAGIDAIIHFAANTGVPNSVADPRLDMEW